MDDRQAVESEEAEARGREEQRSQRGANLVEYVLLCSLIAVLAIVALRAVGSKVSQNYSTVTSVLW